MVIVSKKMIACPVVSRPHAAVVLNKASLGKFASRVRPEGLLVYNSSLIDTEPQTNDVETVAIPAEEIALELGSSKSVNMVMLGAYLHKRGFLTSEQAAEALPDVLAERYHKTIPVNTEALRRGAEFVLCHA
jgi:2-oxoglutarate ferredoxin oxidoreductase subunit gamma